MIGFSKTVILEDSVHFLRATANRRQELIMSIMIKT